MLKSVLKLSFASVAVLAAGASGCLTRPVSPNEPTTKVNVNTRLKQQAVDKIDLLLAIDNSSSMGDKQAFLAEAVPKLVSRLVTPNCIDGDQVTGTATLNSLGEGECANGGAPEFKPITDIHIGVVSSSLGAFGNTGDDAVGGCDSSVVSKGPNDPASNDRAQLINRTGVQSANAGFLAWFPSVQKNEGKPAQQEAYGGSDGDPTQLNTNFASLVTGVGEKGCGLEAQLESVYQFLIAPQPWQEITIGANGAEYTGINVDVLRQRHDFLRPDSLVAVIMLTDEDDSSVDPLSVGGAGRYFMATSFPQPNPPDPANVRSSDQTTTAARGTQICETSPGDPNCTSCAYAYNSPPVEAVKADPNCATQASAYYPGDDDSLNVRFFDMKRRFGVDPQYPIQRYVKGLSSPAIAGRNSERHDGQPDDATDCVNPLFYGGELPTDGSNMDALCKLQGGEQRDPNLVFFALVGGIPNELLDKDSGARDEDNNLTPEAWVKILGNDPLNYDFSGKDPRMVQSITPRDGRPGTSAPDFEGADPLNKTHRDWDTQKGDLQYACTFPIPADLQRPANEDIDCKPKSDAPLCAPGDKNTDRVQVRAKAYPTIREAMVVRQLGSQGILGSLCPKVTEGDKNSAEYGYNPAVNEIVDRLKNALTQTCLPQALEKNDNGEVPCLMLELMPEGVNSCNLEGRSEPDQEIVKKFREGLEDPKLESRTVCQLGQNPGATSVDSCQAGQGANAAWCYLDGANAGRCTQQVVFNDRILALAKGSTVFLQCINQYSPSTGGGSSSSSSGEASE